MRGISLILLTSLLLFAAACSKTEANSELEFKQELQIIFFTDERQYEYEAPYYEAIIHLKKKFPEEFKNMLVLSPQKAERYFKKFKIKKSPAIVVLHKQETIAKVQGEHKKDKIIEPISAALTELSEQNLPK